MNGTAERVDTPTKRVLVVLAAMSGLVAGACSSDQDLGTDAALTGTTEGPSYSTQFFTVPFDVEVPSHLDPTPADDTENFVRWGSRDGSVASE